MAMISALMALFCGSACAQSAAFRSCFGAGNCFVLSPPLNSSCGKVNSGPKAWRGKRRHRAVDLAGSVGDPVFAAVGGKTIVKESYRGGKYVCIDSKGPGPRLRSCYMHLDRVLVADRIWVKRGQQIGTVGRSGVYDPRTRTHLHYQCKWLPSKKRCPVTELLGPWLCQS
jgi:murein DD-endopeptidase MepM/ murein hydrolase activator NlpD